MLLRVQAITLWLIERYMRPDAPARIAWAELNHLRLNACKRWAGFMIMPSPCLPFLAAHRCQSACVQIAPF